MGKSTISMAISIVMLVYQRVYLCCSDFVRWACASSFRQDWIQEDELWSRLNVSSGELT